MSASDIPEMRPDSSLAFARILVQTMKCDQAVQERIREDFKYPPCLRTIRNLRIEVALERMPRVETDPWKAHEGFNPTDVGDKLRDTNANFLRRLRAAYPERFAA